MTLELVEIDETVEQFHHRDLTAISHDQMWVPKLPAKPILVLGSRQRRTELDQDACARLDLPVVRRRSGGGAVLVGADELVWVDIVITRNHPDWTNDVGRSFDWLSDRLCEALSTLGISGTPHRGGLVSTPWSSRICFAGLGPGEITIDSKKAVGISQRRTRTVARFQIAVLRRWDPAPLTAVYPLTAAERSDANVQLRDVAVGIPADPHDIVRAIANALGARPMAG